MPVVNIIIGAVADAMGAAQIGVLAGRAVRIARGRVHDEFVEADHPRAENGQFGSGGTIHVVTTRPEGGEGEVRAVTDDEGQAEDVHDSILYAEDDDDADSVEMHSVPLARGPGDAVDAVHVLHSVDYSGSGVVIHGAYTDPQAARDSALALSKGAWEQFGPERGDLDRSEHEENLAVERWNQDHADDHDGVSVKMDDQGDVERDASGDLQWMRHGEDVEPSEDHQEAFDAHFDRMFPPNDRAAFPGLDAANDHFEGDDDLANVFRIHTHKVA